ncbi:MAG: hypothetical protein EXS12_08780 [Phycisphaerales bacterium]|nr:hypothetical protein [Phycisphaerales bacterium]
MKTGHAFVATLALASSAAMLCVGMGFGFGAGSPNSTGPTIEGTYMLEYRETSDGKKMMAPEIVGMLSYSKTVRNFNVYWMSDGKPSSISIVAKYTLSDKVYTEDCMYYAQNRDGKGITYETRVAHGVSPVTMKDGEIQFTPSLHGEPMLSINKSGMIATKTGAFTDHWKKMD